MQAVFCLACIDDVCFAWFVDICTHIPLRVTLLLLRSTVLHIVDLCLCLLSPYLAVYSTAGNRSIVYAFSDYVMTGI